MTEGPGGGIRLESVTKTYPNRVRAVDAVDLEIAPGEFMVLVGPSGCGKSTLLRMIAGLEEIDGGRIEIAGEDVTNVSPQERDIAMVFQNYALYPHMTVARNLAFGLRMRSTPKAEIERRVADVAQVLGLTELLGRRPGQLSGGQRQRVAMGRAMVREPAAYLMDEPLSNLDAKLRVSMRAELARLHDRLRVATIYVTHDQIEAMTLGERVAVLRDGRLQQCDRPKVLYDQPANLFVAAFIGSPAMNLAEAEISGGCARFAGMAIPLPGADAFEGRRVVFGIRPPDLALAERDDPRPTIELVPEVVEELGSESLVVAPIEARPVAVEAVAAARDAHAGGDDRLLMDDARATWTMRIAGRVSVRVGEPLRVALDPAHVHLFDPESGATLTLGA